MKFNCIVSDTTLGGHKALFGLLREQNHGNERHIFVVPDRYTLGVEKEICETLYPDGAFNVDVCTFTRLAQKALGKRNKACLSKEGTVLLLNRVIGELGDKLTYYRNVKSVAFSREMFASLAAIRSSKISVEELEEKSKKISGGVGDKLRDIAIIYRAYENALKEKYFDTVTRVDWLIENIGSSDYVKDSHIYVLGFNVYSNAQLEFIKRAILFCPSVSVAFTDGENNPNAECFPRRQRDELIEFVRHAGAPTDLRRVTEVLSEEFDFLHREAFAPDSNVKRYVKDAVRIHAEENAYEEARVLAREIRHLAIECGYRYREIAVAVNNCDLNPLISAAFKRFGIPYFIDEKYNVSCGFFATEVFRITACLANGMDRRDVMPLVRHPYIGFGAEEIRTFENYCIRYGVDYSRFLSPFVLGECEKAEEVRAELMRIIETVPYRASAREFCDAVLRLSESAVIEEKEREFSSSDNVAERVYADKEKFLGVIREIGSLCGEGYMSVGEFSDMLSAVLENMTVSVLPQYADAVFVGNMSESRFSDVRALFVAGANDGFFPVTTGDKLVLGCYDTEIMRRNGLAVFPSPEESNFFERFALIDLISKPERLYVTYARTAVDGTALVEGSGVREIKFRLCLGEKSFEAYYGFDEEQLMDYRLGTAENCLFEYVSGKIPKEYAESVRRFLIEEKLLEEVDEGERGADLLAGYPVNADGSYRMSVSKMEAYFKCPYKNLLTNVLGLSEREEGELKVNDKGIIIHAVLEKYFSVGHKLRTMNEVERSGFARSCVEGVLSAPEYKRFEENGVTKKELDGIRRECEEVLKRLTENMLRSDFTPIEVEKRFGDGGEITLTVNGKKFVFYGFVDRVDASSDGGIVIIDYKTGTVEERTADVFTGKKIQLYLYLKYFLDKGYKADGVFYLPIADGYVKKNKGYALRGQMKRDINTFIKLDNRVKEAHNTVYESPNVAFGAITVDGEPDFASVNVKNLVSEKDFSDIADYVMRLCEKAIGELEDGFAERKPIKGACEYCPYAKICGEVAERVDVPSDIGSFAPVKNEGEANEVE